jgi:hypothetical protein
VRLPRIAREQRMRLLERFRRGVEIRHRICTAAGLDHALTRWDPVY